MSWRRLSPGLRMSEERQPERVRVSSRFVLRLHTTTSFPFLNSFLAKKSYSMYLDKSQEHGINQGNINSSTGRA
jgi:hypothetical protein